MGYGLGLKRRDRHGVVGLCHDGSVVGFHAMLCLFPQPSRPGGDVARGGKAFVIVHNTDGDGADTGRFDALLVKALSIPTLPMAQPAQAPRDVADWQGRYVPAPNRFASFRYFDFLFDSPRLGWDGTRLRLAPVQGPERVLAPASGMRFTANDRSTASHVLLQGEGGERLLSDGLRTYRRVHAAVYWLVAASLALGLLGLLWFLLGVPVRALVRRDPVLVPGVIATVLLLLPVPLFLLQSYTQLGDRTAASLTLYAVTAALPLLMLWQAWRSAKRREGLARVASTWSRRCWCCSGARCRSAGGCCRSRCGGEGQSPCAAPAGRHGIRCLALPDARHCDHAAPCRATIQRHACHHS